LSASWLILRRCATRWRPLCISATPARTKRPARSYARWRGMSPTLTAAHGRRDTRRGMDKGAYGADLGQLVSGVRPPWGKLYKRHPFTVVGGQPCRRDRRHLQGLRECTTHPRARRRSFWRGGLHCRRHYSRPAGVPQIGADVLVPIFRRRRSTFLLWTSPTASPGNVLGAASMSFRIEDRAGVEGSSLPSLRSIAMILGAEH